MRDQCARAAGVTGGSAAIALCGDLCQPISAGAESLVRRRKLRLLLASSSMAALLVGGGAPSALAAACTHTITAAFDNPSGHTTANICVSHTSFTGNITNEGTISPSGIAFISGTITGSVKSTGVVNGGISLDSASEISGGITGIVIAAPSFAGGIVSAGTISAGATGIFVGGTRGTGTTLTISTFTGGIINSSTGTISALRYGIEAGGSASGAGASVTLSTFTGGITNSGTVTVSGNTGIFVGGDAHTGASVTIETFAGGIANSGSISAPSNGIWVGGGADLSASVTIASFWGGITNSAGGTIDAGSAGIAVGAFTDLKKLTISNFSGGIFNAGRITASDIGVAVGSPVTGATQVTISTFSGGISNSGTIFVSAGGIVVGGNDGAGVSGTTKNAFIAISSFSGGIANSGTISAGGNGLVVGGSASISSGFFNNATVAISTFSGGISNSGAILASGDGILAGGNATMGGTDGTTSVGISTFQGGIQNSGTISAGGIAIFVGGNADVSTGSNQNATVRISTFSDGVNNTGTITAIGNGIFVGGNATVASGDFNPAIIVISAFSGGVSNAGTISATGIGIFVGGKASVTGGSSNTASVTISTFSGGIINTGSISAGGDGIRVGGDASIAGLSNIASVTILTFSGGITNSGKLSFAGSDGIFINAVSTFAGGIINSGTLSGVGRSDLGISVNNVSAFSGGITNSGILTAVSLGIRVSTVSTYSGGITNSGTISAGAANAGIFLEGPIATFGGGITNSGTLIAGSGIVIGSNVTFAAGAAIVNSGTITGAGGTAINAQSATSPVIIDQTAGLISGDVKLSANADVLNISGGAINGNIAGAGSSDTINFNIGSGTFTYGPAFGFAAINQVNVNSGTVILDGGNSATTTIVNGGNLEIGDAANPAARLTGTVNVDGGTLSGHGTIQGAVTIASGGTLAPGGSIGTLTIANGPLTFNANSAYAIQLDATTASKTLVNGAPGTAVINGGTVVAMPQFTGLGARGAMTYTILTATGGRTGTFAALTSNDPNFTGTYSLSYDANDVFLSVSSGFRILPLPPGLTINQHDVVTGINNGIMNGDTIPANFQTLNGLTGPTYLNALTQLDGEVATGAQVGAFLLDDQFLNLMLNPFVNGRGYAPGAPGAGLPLGFAPDQAASVPDDVALAYAAILGKAPPKQTFDQRWSVWGAGYGGGNTTNGDPAVVGSNKVTASTFGYAAGMDYHVSPNTIVGFALSGGGTNWNLANALGTGRSDTMLAGAYGVTWYGPAYLAGSLAFGNYWFSTDRTALGDQLRANFIGQSYGARFEGGYRYAVLPTLGVTPYAALELQDFHTPSYSESDLTGGGFGLAYNALSATDVRTELGGRFDAPTLVYGKPLVLYGRLAWAHDFVRTPSLSATFQLLPGSGFTVFGAPIAHDSALASAGAQLFLTHNWSLIGTFNGQFASGSQTYTGSGTLRYTW